MTTSNLSNHKKLSEGVSPDTAWAKKVDKETLVFIIFVLIGLLTMLLGLLLRNDETYFTLSLIIGVLIVLIDMSHFLITKSVEEKFSSTSQKIDSSLLENQEMLISLLGAETKKIVDKNGELRKTLEEMEIGLSGYFFTSTSDTNWDCALNMVSKIQKTSVVFDVSSHRNIPIFDDLLLEKAKRGATIKRIICFDPDDPNQLDTRKWFLEMMDPGEDEEGKYDDIRNAMKCGDYFIYHLPQASFMDFFVCDYDGDGQSVECVLGFRKEFDLKPELHSTYTAGLYIKNITSANAFKEFCAGFLIDFSKRHLKEQLEKQADFLADQTEEPACLCINFLDAVNEDRLKPLEEGDSNYETE